MPAFETEDDSSGYSAGPAARAEPHLLLVMFADHPSRYGGRFTLAGAERVVFARSEELTVARVGREGAKDLQLGIPARTLSGTHAALHRDGETFLLEDLGSRNGTFVNGERVRQAALADGDIVEMGRTFFVFRAALAEGPVADLLPAALASEPPAFRTLLPALAARFALLRRVARSDVPVLLEGPTGAGKEVLARAVHEASGRKGDFVAVNCGALPESLVEAQLFGHRKGAFSGATNDEPGFVRSADGGTLLLDEIGDLALPAQAALLRVLQEREVVPVGATRPIRVDVRIVSATHRALDALVAEGRFRADLLARLRGFRHAVTPLRERREDLGLIIADVLARLESREALHFMPSVVRAFLQYMWPLSIRELHQCLRAATAMTSGDILTPNELPEGDLAMFASVMTRTPSEEAPPIQAARVPALPIQLPSIQIPPIQSLLSDAQLDEMLRAHLVQSGGNVAAIARALGKAPFQVRRWLKRLGLDPDEYRART